MLKLDLGCGGSPHEGYLAVDNNPLAKPDIVHDLNDFPYPFGDSSVDEIIMQNVLEHVEDPIKSLEEIYRISKPGAVWKITIPHYTRGFRNPTHKIGFARTFFNLINGNFPRASEKYLNLDIDIVKEEYRWSCVNSGFVGVFNKFWSKVLNYNDLFTDRFMCFWFGGIDEMYFEVVVIKGMPYDKGLEFRRRLMRR